MALLFYCMGSVCAILGLIEFLCGQQEDYLRGWALLNLALSWCILGTQV